MSFPKIEGYVVTEKLGSGSYSTVYKANTKVGAKSIVAIKCVDKSRVKHSGSAVDNLIREIRLLKTLTHPHIVHMKHFEWDDKNIYIIMEYCCGGDLSKYIHKYGRVPERQVLYFLQQLASALKFLREKGVVHMDLKPHNLLLHKGSDGKYILKVGDFGFAQYMSQESMSSVRGSPLYMAPEMLAGQYDAAVDLWSVGVIMYECLFGRAPYSSSTLKELIDKIQSKAPIEVPRNSCISPGCADLLTRLLQHDPKNRITYEEFFNHEYLDLEHMPSKENYEKAVCLIKQAIELDSSGKQQEAFESYRDSLLYLVPVVNCESDALRKSALTAKLTRYMERAEEIKHNLKYKNSMPSINTSLAPKINPKRPTCCVSGNSSTNSYEFGKIKQVVCAVCQNTDINVKCECVAERDNIAEREHPENDGSTKPSASSKPVNRSPSTSRFGFKRLFGKSIPYLDNQDSSITDDATQSEKKTQNPDSEGCRIT